jgi:hypothetical protein
MKRRPQHSRGGNEGRCLLSAQIVAHMLRCTVGGASAAGLGQTQPPSFVAATAELASIADAGEAWRGPRSATSPRRQVLPNDRTPRLTGVAPAPGQ